MVAKTLMLSLVPTAHAAFMQGIAVRDAPCSASRQVTMGATISTPGKFTREERLR